MKMNELVEQLIEIAEEKPRGTLAPLFDALISQYLHDLRNSIQLSTSAKQADFLVEAFNEAK